MPSIARAQGRGQDGPATSALRDSTAIEPQALKTHRLKYGVLGAVVGTAVGIGVGALIISGNHSDMESLWYVYTVPPGFVLGTIVGVAIGGRGMKRPTASLDFRELGQPQHRSVPLLRLAATVTF